MGLIYKVADQEWEFESIHKLNYKTFVEEIPQHEETIVVKGITVLYGYRYVSSR